MCFDGDLSPVMRLVHHFRAFVRWAKKLVLWDSKDQFALICFLGTVQTCLNCGPGGLRIVQSFNASTIIRLLADMCIQSITLGLQLRLRTHFSLSVQFFQARQICEGSLAMLLILPI